MTAHKHGSPAVFGCEGCIKQGRAAGDRCQHCGSVLRWGWSSVRLTTPVARSEYDRRPQRSVVFCDSGCLVYWLFTQTETEDYITEYLSNTGRELVGVSPA